MGQGAEDLDMQWARAADPAPERIFHNAYVRVDIHEDALRLLCECQKLLADLTNGDRDFQKQQSSQHLWARCVELEAKCRAAHSKQGGENG